MEGLLLVNKPVGWTSFDVVAFVRRIVAQSTQQKPRYVKIGHSGTLDPFATGLLVLFVGRKYTRRVAEYTKQDKTYEVTMRLGMTSTTGDPEGQLTPYSDILPSFGDIERVLSLYEGTISQTPPVFSAIKVNGQRAYKLARAGKDVTMPVRTVTVQQIRLTSYEYPTVRFSADVSSGTYIRSLVEDVGKDLNTGAYTLDLRRTRVGSFSVDDSVDVDSLNVEIISRRLMDA